MKNFVLVTGDGDFTSIVSDLKANEKTVIGMSSCDKSTSTVLKNSCDEFISLRPDAVKNGVVLSLKALAHRTRRMVAQIDKREINISLIKDLLLRSDASFSEENYGMETFTQLLREMGFHVQYLKGLGNYLST